MCPLEPLTTDERKRAFALFCEHLEDKSKLARPTRNPLPYDVCPRIKLVAWKLPFIEMMIDGDLIELTNEINRWRGALRRWDAWLKVLSNYSEDDSWKLQLAFVDGIAFQCLYSPIATRDRLTFIATSSIHQVRMALDPARKDRLDGDEKFLRRSDAEKQLRHLSSRWPSSPNLTFILSRLDDATYRIATRDFRNLSSHSIAPRLNIGYTRLVSRNVELLKQSASQPGPTTRVSYSIGGTAPLSMSSVFDLNLGQFAIACDGFAVYTALLNEALNEMSLRL